MPRPRQHDPERVLDAALRLWVAEGIGAITIRALSAATGISNGSIYHGFGSRETILARLWARQAQRFIAVQRAAIDTAPDPTQAILAVARAPATYAAQDELGARLLLAVKAEELPTGDLDEADRALLAQPRQELGRVIVDLAAWLANSAAPRREAIILVRYCVVELPGALLLGRGRVDDPLALDALTRAVHGILTSPLLRPPPPSPPPPPHLPAV